jgi:WXXGXW repeat (2 copies)
MRSFRIAFFYFIIAASAVALAPVSTLAQIGVSITIAPPALPVYWQPPIPGPGYIWTPGYWAYGPYGYYWVPGTWVRPHAVGLLWTPGYWSWVNGAYVWRAGYWGPRVGFYGGINYGFGYGGAGYVGGYWNHGAFYYNRATNNISSKNITNVYTQNINVNRSVTNVAFNGGPGGVRAQATAEEIAAAHAQRIPPTATQVQQQQAAGGNRALLASVNHGRPPIAATARPGEFPGHGIVAAPGAAAGAVRQQPGAIYPGRVYAAPKAAAERSAEHALARRAPREQPVRQERAVQQPHALPQERAAQERGASRPHPAAKSQERCPEGGCR